MSGSMEPTRSGHGFVTIDGQEYPILDFRIVNVATPTTVESIDLKAPRPTLATWRPRWMRRLGLDR